jgi:hypothetical protein
MYGVILENTHQNMKRFAVQYINITLHVIFDHLNSVLHMSHSHKKTKNFPHVFHFVYQFQLTSDFSFYKIIPVQHAKVEKEAKYFPPINNTW